MRSILSIAALAALATGCASTPKGPPEPIREKAEVYRIEVRDQDFTEFTALAHIQLPPGITPTKAHWEILSGTPLTPLASGDSPIAAEDIPADGVIQVGGRTAYTDDPDTLSELMAEEGSIPLVVRGHVVAGDVHYEFTRAGRLRTPRVPTITVRQVEAGAIPTEHRIGLVFFIRVDNPNSFDVPLENISYDLRIGGLEIDKGIVGTRRMIPRGAAVEVDLPVSLTEQNFPEIEKYFRGDGQISYGMTGEVRLEMGRIPYELKGPIQIRSSRY